MTTPVERTNAVIYTEEFLLDLCDPKTTQRVPKAIRERARHMLRHYPSKFEMQTIADREDGCEAEVVTRLKIFGKGYQ